MLMVISPAKTLDYETAPVTERHTLPRHLEHSRELIEVLREKSPQEIGKLMSISDKLAALNVARFGSWSDEFTTDNSKQALLAFKGDVYTGLHAEDFSEEDFDFAQQHLRMLSGLYGILRPLDLMQPYRLEMGTRLATWTCPMPPSRKVTEPGSTTGSASSSSGSTSAVKVTS